MRTVNEKKIGVTRGKIHVLDIFFLTSLCMDILISCINGTFILVVRGESMMVLSTVKPTCFN
jgi:hypothetical protein